MNSTVNPTREIAAEIRPGVRRPLLNAHLLPLRQKEPEATKQPDQIWWFLLPNAGSTRMTLTSGLRHPRPGS